MTDIERAEQPKMNEEVGKEQQEAKDNLERNLGHHEAGEADELRRLQEQATPDQYFSEGVNVANRVAEISKELLDRLESGKYERDDAAYMEMKALMEEARRFLYDPAFGIAETASIEQMQDKLDATGKNWEADHVKPTDLMAKVVRGELPADLSGAVRLSYKDKEVKKQLVDAGVLSPGGVLMLGENTLRELAMAGKAAEVLDDAGKQEALAKIDQLREKMVADGQRAVEIARSKSLPPEGRKQAIEKQRSLFKQYEREKGILAAVLDKRIEPAIAKITKKK